MDAALHDHVADTLRAHGIVRTSCVIGVSGGIDSSTLLQCCITISEALELELHVVHVNHGLRGVDSDDDEAMVRATCEQHGVPCYVVQARPHDEASFVEKGLEASARDIRYRTFAAYAENHGIRYVVTGHTLDDHAETILMHLARGSGAKGLSGIPHARALSPTVSVVRPFRHHQRSEIIAYAQRHHVVWRDDASNETDAFQRNRVRHMVIPAMHEALGAHVLRAIDRSSDHLRRLSSFIDDLVAVARRTVIDHHDTSIVVHLAPLQTHHPTLVDEILRQGLECSYDDLERVRQLVHCQVGSVATISGHRQVVREREALVVYADEMPTPFPEVGINGDGQYVAGSHCLHVMHMAARDVVPRGGQSMAYVDAASVQGNLVWRAWEHGDRFQPFGMEGHILVSDLLTNAHVPHHQRNSIRVVCDDEGIIWVCGFRQSERTRVTSATVAVYVLSHEPFNP